MTVHHGLDLMKALNSSTARHVLTSLMFVSVCVARRSLPPSADNEWLWLSKVAGQRHIWEGDSRAGEGQRNLLCNEDPEKGSHRCKGECAFIYLFIYLLIFMYLMSEILYNKSFVSVFLFSPSLILFLSVSHSLTLSHSLILHVGLPLSALRMRWPTR